MIVQVQAILFASLAASLFSAFLAMLGKQWLSRYDSTEMRGTAIERSQSRQRKLNGIITWYFRYVMESLPLMLQAALLLLGCALSRYLWDINVIVASVILGVTSFGVTCYLFIVVAGAAFESCPYQTPGASALHLVVSYAHLHVLPSLHPAFILSMLSTFIRDSHCHFFLVNWWETFQRPRCSIPNVTRLFLLLLLPIPLAADVYLLGRGILRRLVGFGERGYRWWLSVFGRIHWSLVLFCRSAYRWFASIPQAHGSDQHAIMLDLQCVSWILQTSLDKLIHLATLKYLMTIPELAYLDPALVVDCFNAFTNCVSISYDRVVILRGLEELVAVSTKCFLSALLHLLVTDPTSSTLADLRRRYNKVFPPFMDFTGLPSCSTMTTIHLLFGGDTSYCLFHDYIAPVAQGHFQFSQDVVNSARREYQRTQHRKVPRRFLHFVIHSLSMDPPPPASVVADCLKIIAIDLGCDLANLPARNDG